MGAGEAPSKLCGPLGAHRACYVRRGNPCRCRRRDGKPTAPEGRVRAKARGCESRGVVLGRTRVGRDCGASPHTHTHFELPSPGARPNGLRDRPALRAAENRQGPQNTTLSLRQHLCPSESASLGPVPVTPSGHGLRQMMRRNCTLPTFPLPVPCELMSDARLGAPNARAATPASLG